MIRAYIGEDRIGRSLAISLIDENEGDHPTAILRISDASTDNPVYRWEPLGEPTGAEIAPTLRLRDIDARALLDALARHYHGAEDTRALRRDYDAERKRTDQLTATLGVIATRLAEMPGVVPAHHGEAATRNWPTLDRRVDG